MAIAMTNPSAVEARNQNRERTRLNVDAEVASLRAALQSAEAKQKRVHADAEAREEETLEEARRKTLVWRQKTFLRRTRMDIGKRSRRKDNDADCRERTFEVIYREWVAAGKSLDGVPLSFSDLEDKVRKPKADEAPKCSRGERYSRRQLMRVVTWLVDWGFLERPTFGTSSAQPSTYAPSWYPMALDYGDEEVTVSMFLNGVETGDMNW